MCKNTHTYDEHMKPPKFTHFIVIMNCSLEKKHCSNGIKSKFLCWSERACHPYVEQELFISNLFCFHILF